MAALDWKDHDGGSSAPASRDVGGEYRIEIVWGYSEGGECCCRYYKPLRLAPIGQPLTALELAKAICQAHHDKLLKAKGSSSHG
jgi:hypothetical protein